MDSKVSGQNAQADSCEYGNEHSDYKMQKIYFNSRLQRPLK